MPGLDRFDSRCLPGLRLGAANLPAGPPVRRLLHHRRWPGPDRCLRLCPHHPHLHPRPRQGGRSQGAAAEGTYCQQKPVE